MSTVFALSWAQTRAEVGRHAVHFSGNESVIVGCWFFGNDNFSWKKGEDEKRDKKNASAFSCQLGPP
jgi:hypothetical protein